MNVTDICNAIESLERLDGAGTEALCRTIRGKAGYSNWTHVTQKLNRERLNVDKEARGERRRYRPAEYKRLYHRQHGICLICDAPMAMPRNWPGDLEMDHVDPNATDWDSEGNRQVVHAKCNREKSSKTPHQMSKETGKTVVEMLPGDESRPEL